MTERRSAEAEVERLADEQAALRRVATLVARDASQAELFTVIATECAQMFGTEDIGMVRYEGDRHQVVMASSGMFRAAFPTGSRQPLGGDNAASLVFRTGRPARIDDYATASGPIADAIRPMGLRCAVATPIIVEGRLWGAMIMGTSGGRALAVGNGIPPRPVHRADGHRDRQLRVACPSRPADGGAGRSAPGGDACR